MQTRNVSRGHGCPRITKFAYSLKQKKVIFMNCGQSLWKPQYDMDHLKLEQDILM